MFLKRTHWCWVIAVPYVIFILVSLSPLLYLTLSLSPSLSVFLSHSFCLSQIGSCWSIGGGKFPHNLQISLSAKMNDLIKGRSSVSGRLGGSLWFGKGGSLGTVVQIVQAPITAVPMCVHCCDVLKDKLIDTRESDTRWMTLPVLS